MSGFLKIDWPLATFDLSLKKNQIQVFAISTNRSQNEIKRFFRMLSTDEMERAKRFKFDNHRNRFIVVRGALRELLGKQLNLSPDSLEFDYLERGKPFIKTSFLNTPLKFNLTHSNDIALYAIAHDVDIGIDVEYILPSENKLKAVGKIFSKYEQKVLTGMSNHVRHKAFYECWTCKEALVKAIGGGISIPFDQFDIDVSQFGKPRILEIRLPGYSVKEWSIFYLKPHQDYIGAVAARGKDFSLNCWSLDNQS